MNAIQGSFKGHSTITVPITEKRTFTIGIMKARVVLLYLKEIQEFVATHYKEPQETEQEVNTNSLDELFTTDKFYNTNYQAKQHPSCITLR